MKSGRKALPEAVKKGRGTDRQDRRKPEPVMLQKMSAAAIDKMPKLPQLSDRGMSLFRARAKQLAALDLCDNSFLDGLIIYAQWYDIALRAADEVNQSPLTDTITKSDGSATSRMNESLKVLKIATDAINRIGCEYGFNPVSRQNIETERHDLDPVEELTRLSECE